MNTESSILMAASGTVIVSLVCFDVFQSIILPRATSRRLRIAPLLVGKILWPTYRTIVRKLPIAWRASWYRSFAP